jgi:hypothetical protein
MKLQSYNNVLIKSLNDLNAKNVNISIITRLERYICTAIGLHRDSVCSLHLDVISALAVPSRFDKDINSNRYKH